MADFKDILGVPRTGPDKSEPKEKKEKLKRPEGMSREAFALYAGGSHPIIPTHLTQGLKGKKDAKQKPQVSTRGPVTYQWKQFIHPARKDGLQLFHWVKGFKDAAGRIRDAEEGEYPFAKLNKKVQLFRYDDEEWANLIAPDSVGWSRDETDYFLDLCEQFDLRFVVIADRYNFPGGPSRSMEDLKERYYSMARKLLIAREGGEAAVANHLLVKHPFNKAHEVARKQALNALLSRTARQEQEENAILEEAKVIEEARRAERARKGHMSDSPSPAPASPLHVSAPAAPSAPVVAPAAVAAFAARARFPAEFAQEPAPGTPSLFNANLEPFRPPRPGVYARGAHTREIANAQAAAMAGGPRAQKAIESALQEVNYPGVPHVNTRAVCGAFLALRGEVIAMLDLKRTMQNRQAGDEARGKRGEKRKK